MTKTKGFSKVTALLLSLLMAIGVIASSVTSVSAADLTIDDTKTGSLTIYKLATKGLSELEVEALYDAEVADGTYTGTLADYTAAKYYENTENTPSTYHEYLDGAEYTIYKIGEISQTTSSTPPSATIAYKYVTNTGGNYTAGETIPLTGTGKIDADTFDLTGFGTGTAVTTGAAGTPGKAEFTGLSLGLYLVKETKTPAGVAISNNFFVQIPMTDTDSSGNSYWNYDVVAYPKNTSTDMTIDKTITGGTVVDPNNNNNTVSLGDSVSYQIKATTPADLAVTEDTSVSPTEYTSNYIQYDIVDKASQYLTILNTASNPITVTAVDKSDVSVSLTAGVDYTITGPTAQRDPLNSADTTTYNMTYVKFTAEGLYKLGASATITVTYTAQVSATVPEGTTAITNNSRIEYDTTEDNDPDPIDPDEPTPPTVYLYDYATQKIDEASNALAGAEFVLAQYLDDVTGAVVTKGTAGSTLNYLAYNTTDGWYYTTDITNTEVVRKTSAASTDTDYAEGIFTYRGLAYGTYYLVETKAPTTTDVSGNTVSYTLLADSVEIVFTSATTTTANNKNASDKYDGYSIQIVNNMNGDIDLPETGGNGIYIFLIVGAALIITATVLYVKSRKKNNEAQ